MARTDRRLAVLKALGDNTRYAIYLELARSSVPLATSEIAESLDLHPNTVRDHLEKMRDLGLLQMETESQGVVGRPQHRYSLAPDAPSLGLEPPVFRLLATMLADVAALGGPDVDDVAAMAWDQGRQAAERARGDTCAEALTHTLAELGFDPATAVEGGEATIAFTHCPFRELAELYPDIVCNLHRGMIEGFVEQFSSKRRPGSARVTNFATLADRDPCRVELASR